MSQNPDTSNTSNTSEARQANVGQLGQLGRYELLERLAVGGMGEVFLARERSVAGVSRIVVVKRLLPQLADDPEQVALFIDEARITSQLAHPNIAQIYEFGVDDGVHFLAMEYVQGKDLAHLCERASRLGFSLSRELAVYVVAEAVRGLHFAHIAKDEHGRALDIVHRDISPHNVLVSRHGDVKLMDFGIASATIRRQRTRTGVLRGKFAYMSPEQVAQKPLDARSDIFSAGVLLWEATLGRRLFAAATELETIRLVSEAKVTPPREIDPAYPEALEALVMTALAYDPANRFQSAAAFESALRSQLVTRREDRRALGAWVQQLFPDVAKLEVEAGRVTSPVTASVDVSPRVTVSTGRRVTAPAIDAIAAEQVVSGAASPDAAPPDATSSDVAPPLTPATRMFAVALPLALLVAAASYFGVRALQEPERSAAPGVASAAMADARQTQSGPQAQTSDAGRGGNSVASAGAASRVDAGDRSPRTATNTRRHRKARPRRTSARTSAARHPLDAGTRRAAPLPVARRTDAAPARASTVTTAATVLRKGKLAVDSKPWGTVSIDGKSRGPSALQVALGPGRHRVSVTLSGGGGTVHATAIIISGKKTKCRATHSSLVCRSPR